MQKIFFQPEVVPAPFFGSPPKAYYAHPALLGTLCQSLGSIGRVVSEKNGNIHTSKQIAIFRKPEMVPTPFSGSPPKAYYGHPALLGTWCQSLGSIGRVVSEKNGNRQTDKQTNKHTL